MTHDPFILACRCCSFRSSTHCSLPTRGTSIPQNCAHNTQHRNTCFFFISATHTLYRCIASFVTGSDSEWLLLCDNTRLSSVATRESSDSHSTKKDAFSTTSRQNDCIDADVFPTLCTKTPNRRRASDGSFSEAQKAKLQVRRRKQGKLSRQTAQQRVGRLRAQRQERRQPCGAGEHAQCCERSEERRIDGGEGGVEEIDGVVEVEGNDDELVKEEGAKRRGRGECGNGGSGGVEEGKGVDGGKGEVVDFAETELLEGGEGGVVLLQSGNDHGIEYDDEALKGMGFAVLEKRQEKMLGVVPFLGVEGLVNVVPDPVPSLRG